MSGASHIVTDIKVLLHADIDDIQVLKKIKKAINTTEKLFFRQVKVDEVQKFIMNLDGSKADGSKATPVGDIPADMVKQTNQIISIFP